MNYKDKTWCAKADNCSFKPCDRRLSDSDKYVIQDGNWMVSWSDFRTCKDFKEKRCKNLWHPKIEISEKCKQDIINTQKIFRAAKKRVDKIMEKRKKDDTNRRDS